MQNEEHFKEFEFTKVKKQKNLKKSCRNFLIKNLDKLIFFNDKLVKIYFKIFKKNEIKRTAKIAVNFVEGVSKSKRSDFLGFE